MSDLDLVTANAFSGDASVLLCDGDGDGGFAAATSVAIGGAPFSIAGDVTGDGKPDLAVARSVSDGIMVASGTGAGSFGPPTTFATVPAPQRVAMGDVNRDSTLDLAVANTDASVLVNAGAARRSRPAAPDFGTQGQGTIGAAKPFTLTASGSAALRVDRIRVTGANANRGPAGASATIVCRSTSRTRLLCKLVLPARSFTVQSPETPASASRCRAPAKSAATAASAAGDFNSACRARGPRAPAATP